jgi:hypothetical protein
LLLFEPLSRASRFGAGCDATDGAAQIYIKTLLAAQAANISIIAAKKYAAVDYLFAISLDSSAQDALL